MVASSLSLSELNTMSVHVDDEYAEMQRIAARDEAAFDALYLRYHPKLTRFVRRILNNPAQIEEVVSDTLFAVWTGASRFQRKSKVSTWIFGIGFRTAMKAVRSGSRQARYTEGAQDPDDLADSQQCNDPAMSAELNDQTNRVLNAMGQLSAEQQAVVELTALGWSCTEIGEIVGCPTNTVKTRMFNARKKLRHVLEGETQSTNSSEQRNE